MSVTRRSSEAGFTLVEVLVATTVLSIGLLGMASLQAHALRASRAAHLHTRAVTLAADLADRIRANRVPADNYIDAGLNARAQVDLADWHAAIAAELPGGHGRVSFRAAATARPAQYQVEVLWRQPGDADDALCALQLEL